MEREIVHQSDSARRENQRDCSSSPHSQDTKSISQVSGEGQSCFVQGIGAAIWGKIDKGHMVLLKS